MIENAIATLARTTPPRKFFNAGRANARITELETALGVSHNPPTFNIIRANKRIEHLENLLAQKNATAPLAPVAAAAPEIAAPAGILSATLVEFQKMDAATRTQFASEGGALSQADFQSLKPAAKMSFMRSGGKILEAVQAASPAPDDPDSHMNWAKSDFAANGATIPRSQFESMSPAIRMEFMRNNGRVID